MCMHLPLVASEPVGQLQEACLAAVVEGNNFTGVLKINKQLEERSPGARVSCRIPFGGRKVSLVVELLDLTA